MCVNCRYSETSIIIPGVRLLITSSHHRMRTFTIRRTFLFLKMAEERGIIGLKDTLLENGFMKKLWK